MPASSRLADIAVSFLQLCAAGKVEEAYDNFAAPHFRHHNPYFHNDANSLKEGMRDSATNHPDKAFEVQRTIAEGDLVAVHSRLQLRTNMPTIAVVHILRFEGEKIAELWDVGQAQPDQMVNENGMF